MPCYPGWTPRAPPNSMAQYVGYIVIPKPGGLQMDTRRLHRRVMSIFGLLLLYWALSGLVIASYDLRDPEQAWAVMGGGPGASVTLEARRLPALPAPETLHAGIEAALAAAAGMPIASADLRMARGQARLQLAEADGDRAHLRRYFAATGQPMTQDEAEDPAADAQRTARHDWIKSWHKGDIAGLPGQFLGLATALVLATMLVTGLSIYLRLLRARRKAGRRAVFWRVPRESWWRRVHRWVAVIAAVLLVNTVVTGLVLASAEILLQLAIRYHVGVPPYPRPSPLPPLSDGPLVGNLPDALQRTYAAATPAAAPDPVVIVQLLRRDGRQLGLATTAGPHARVLAFDMAGQPITSGSGFDRQRGNGYFADWHQIVKRMHRGDIIGTHAGRYIAIANGCALLYLAISGFVMYLRPARPKS
jgi:uncharacterized iron-regulated membrane protein